MANFKTHLNVAAAVMGTGALLITPFVGLPTALWLWVIGINGGLLPDIDADNSTSLDIIFNIICGSIILSIIFLAELSVVNTGYLVLAVYVFLKFFVRKVFEKMTRHRGSCHSVLFLIFCSLLLVNIVDLVAASIITDIATVAWLSGGSLFLGGTLHLLLDEIYSVDISNVRIKRSFGTALKLYAKNKIIVTMLLFMSSLLLYSMTPQLDIFFL